MIGTRGTYCAKRLLKALLMQAFLFATLITPRGPTGGSVAGALKIAVYSHSLPPEVDGVSRRFSMLIEEFKRRGHEVFVFTLEKDLELKGVEPVTLLDFATGLAAYPTKKIGKPGWSELCKITDVLKAEKPDVLHVTNDALSSQFVLAARFAGIPIVGSIHTDVIRILEVRLRHLFASYALTHSPFSSVPIAHNIGTTSFVCRR
jgi:glycosyltransferase involved in cell wall biosynthesis